MYIKSERERERERKRERDDDDDDALDRNGNFVGHILF